MILKGFLKRLLPFAAALALGLFVASFFVTVAAPRFSFKRGGSMKMHHRKDRQMKLEYQRLREELRQKEQRIAELEMKQNMDFEGDFNKLIPPPPPAPLNQVR